MGTRLRRKLNKKKSSSNYCRNSKAPYRYSPEYYAWREAVLKGKPVDIVGECAHKHNMYVDRVRRTTQYQLQNYHIEPVAA